ncbi:glycine oxidase ThiO [bacterium]|nr:glycine oxidase ThiO [bacterium]
MKAVIVGGGISGGAIAWRLAREGVAVIVLERGRLGREASWAAAGMIAPQAEAQSPGVFFDLCMAGRRVFDATVDRLTVESGVDPEYDPQGILYLALDESEHAELIARARWHRECGATVEELSPAEARRLEPAISPTTVHALHFPDNRRLDNRKLTQAYIAAAIAAGAEFRENSRVDAIATAGGRAIGVVLDDGGRIDADLVIIAAGSWSHEIRGLEQDRVRLFPVRGQILCFEARPRLLGPALFSLRGYLVPRRDGRILAGSTMEEAGFDKSVTLAGIEKIARGAAAMAPAIGELRFREAWAGLRPATRDLLPVLGPSPSVPNVIWATGHYRSGILLSALTGETIADLVAGRKPPIDLAPFSAARFARA